ncbi:bZIP transcription factor [Arachis hypogaea]|nr:bZIP transcription factor [Arachis hypogaea]
MPGPGIIAAECAPQAAEAPSDLAFDDFSSQFDGLPIPSMDALFVENGVGTLNTHAFASDLEFPMDFGDGGDYEITFDDLDNLYIPSDADDFLLPDACNPNGDLILPTNDDLGDCSGKNSDCDAANSDSPESGSCAVYGDRSSGVSRFLNSQSSSESGSFKRELSPNPRDSAVVKDSSFPSHDSDSCGEREESSNGAISSRGSGNGSGSGVYETMNSPSPDCCRYEREISSTHAHTILDRNVKLEDNGKGCDLKRKQDQSEGSAETRTTKFRRSSAPVENKTQQNVVVDDDDEKRKARLMRNRESAQLSRQRKKHYVEELEEKVRSMHSTIADLSSKISFVMAENATLRQQLGVGGMCPPPPPVPGMYPHAPPMAHMPYTWMPCAPYVVKPQGSQVPLVPIPKLKPQQPASSSKSKKSEGPMLSSGMCTEVFQFDASPKPGAIVPATSVANVSRESRQNVTALNKTRNRRILHGLPGHLDGTSLNLTEDHVRNSESDHFHGNKSSMVVSVLVDPKEAADSDVDGVMTPKSISRIFVVVLMDSVKYVTYSCGLPRLSPHLVTA